MSQEPEGFVTRPLAWVSHSTSREGVAELYVTYHRAVASVLFRFGVRDELDDLMQEVFLRAWKNRESYLGKSSAKTWILSITVNLAKDHLKKRRLPVTEWVDDICDPATVQDNDMARALEDGLSRLSVEAREMIVLALIEEYSMAEVSEILRIPVGTVKSRLFAAKREMRHHLEKRGYLKNHES